MAPLIKKVASDQAALKPYWKMETSHQSARFEPWPYLATNAPVIEIHAWRTSNFVAEPPGLFRHPIICRLLSVCGTVNRRFQRKVCV
jgi:hypothetical protein